MNLYRHPAACPRDLKPRDDVWKLIFLLLILLVISLPVHAASGAAELTGLLDQMKTMRAKFTQTVYDNNGKMGVKSYGNMALDRPGKFRWSVEKPMPQVIIANADKLWIYDPDLMQVTIRSLKTEAGEAPALLLSHQNTTLETNYSIEVMQNQKTLRWFTLKPKQKDNMFASVKMGFDEKHQLKEMVLEDQIGHATRVEFNKIEMNITLPANLFTFKAPKGTDIIDETKKTT